MKTAITHRLVVTAGMLGLALTAMLTGQARAAERMVLAEYFTSNY